MSLIQIKNYTQAILLSSMLFLLAHSASAMNTTAYKDLDNQPIHLDLTKPGKPTVLVFWASWCRFCMAEIPTLKKLHSQTSDLQWLGVNVNKNPSDGLKTQTEKQLPYHSISDPNLHIADKFYIQGTPGFIILDKNGKLVHRGRKADKKFVAALLSQHD